MAEAAALTATANKIIQDADSVGTALKTTSLRLRGTEISVLEEEGLDSEGAVTSKSKLQSKVKALSGVDILTATGEYKSTYTILSQIADVWSDINDMDQAALLELLAGKRNSSVLAAILQNPEELKAAFEDANNASGSALKENEKYLDSIQGKIDQFNNATQAMWSNFLSADVVKWFVELGTELIKIVDNIGLLKVALMGVGMYLTRGIDFVDFSKPIEKTVENVKYTLADLKADMDTAVAEDAAKKTDKSHKKAEEATQRYNNYKKQAEELEAEDLLNKKAQERIDLSEQLADAEAELADIWSQGGTGDSDLVDEFDAAKVKVDDLKKKIDENGMSIDDANTRMQAFNNTVDQTGKKGIISFNKLGDGLKKVGKQAVNVLAQMAAMYAITTVIDLLGKGWNALNELGKDNSKSAEAAQEKFDELNNELSQAQSELRSLESELDKTNDRMDELLSMGTLSFVEQEELKNLKEQSSELERQITLAKTLEETLQNVVSLAAINASQKTFSQTSFYSEESKKDRADEAKENGKTWGQLAGLALGTAAAIALAPVTGGLSFAGLAAGAGIGAFAVGGIGAAIGENAENSKYDSEKSVTEVLNNMSEERDKLEKARDEAYQAYVNADPSNKKEYENITKQWEEAQAALGTYDSTLAQHISQMQQYVNSIDPDTLTNDSDKAYYEQMNKWVDTYAVMMGGTDAKTSVIERLFGEDAQGGFAKAKVDLDEIYKKIEKAENAGDELAIADALSELEKFNAEDYLSPDEIAYLHEYGLSVYEAEQYFISQKKAAEDAIDSIETYDAIKNIAKLTSGVNDLKNAFKELHEDGIVSAETLLSLEGIFGDYDGWNEFFDIMASGTSTIEQMEEAAKNLAESYVDGILSKGSLSDAERLTTISYLQSLGITNAREFIDAKIKKDGINNMLGNIGLTDEEQQELDVLEANERHFKNNKDLVDYMHELQDRKNFDQDYIISQLEEEYGIKIDGEEDIKLIQAAITAEKAKQVALEKQAAKNAYDAAKLQQANAKEKNENIDRQINELSSKNIEDLQSKYGVGAKRTAYSTEHNAKITTVEYNGKQYILNNDGSPPQELINAITADLNGQKVKVPSLPVEVTQIDVDNANNAAETAANALQAELDKQGLSLDINLLSFDEVADKVQDVYSTLKNIATEYNTQGYLSLDNLQALLNLTPEYLACLQMENGQITINQQALEGMLQTKLAEAEATAVQTAITQLSALAERKQAIEISNSAVAANQASIELGTYSSALGTVAQDAIIAACSVTEFNNALKGAQDNSFVSDDEINQILSNFNNSVELINSVRNNLPSSFNNILDPGSNTSGQDVAESEWDKLVSRYENRLALITNERDLIEAEIDKAEARGGKATAEYYDDLIRTSAEEKSLLEEQYAAMKSYLDANVDAIDQNTWTEYNNSLNDIAVAIKECETNTIQWQEAIREIDIHYFEQATNEISRLGQELDFVNGLLEDEEVSYENGNWSSAALTRMGMYMNQIEAAAADTQRYQDEIAKLNQQYDAGELSEEQYQDRLGTLTDGLYDSINAQEDARDSIIELNEARIETIKEGIEKEIEAYEDLIDVQKEELQASRDLYEFKNKIKNQTKDISALERRIASLSGSTAASDVAERRKLEAELQKQKEALSDSYYDHAQDARSNALDDEAEAYRNSKEKYIEQLEEQLKDTETLIYNSMMDVLFNADIVYNELNGIADTYGITLSEELKQPWNEASDRAKQWKSELEIDTASLIGEGGAITLFANGVSEKISGAWDNAKASVQTYADFLTGTEIGSKFASTITGFGNQIQTIIDKWNGVKAAADDAWVAQTRTTDVGGNPNLGGGGSDSGSGNVVTTTTPTMHESGTNSTKIAVGAAIDVLNLPIKTINGQSYRQWNDGYYYPQSAFKFLNFDYDDRGKKTSVYGFPAGTKRYKYYAKGTTGVPKDQLAIVDELGPELILHADPTTGRLEYLTKGSGVMTADATSELMKLADIGVDGLMMPKFDSGINMMANYITKPEFNIDIEEFVHVDRVDQDTLPKLEAMMDKKINDFSRALNYSIKKFAR